MRKISWLPIAFLIIQWLPAGAQKKDFTYDQLFGSDRAEVTRSLPAVNGWADNTHYLEFRKEDGDKKSKWMAIDVKTGKASPYTGKPPEPLFGRRRSAPETGDIRISDTSPDGQWIAYTKKDNNLYVKPAAGGAEIQVTTDGSETILNGYASWVYYEEILGRSSRYKAFWWSDDSKHLCFMRFDDSEVPVFPIYWSNGQHGYIEKERYPKPGDKNPEVKIGVLGVDAPANITWADFDPKADQYFGAPYWTPSGQLWVQWMNRGQDDLNIYQINLQNGSKSSIYHETQKTWIDLDEASRIHFLENGKGFLLKSDKDGWENLYYYDMSGRLLAQVTNGSFWGTSIVRVDEKNNLLYFRARGENSARYDFYRVKMDGKNLTRLSFGPYSHDQISLSPDAKYFITTYSNVSTPTTMAIVETSTGKIIRELGNAKGEEFDQYNLPRVELTRVKSFDGKFDLPVIITYPVHFDPSKKYPVLVSIYGGPNAGTVYDRWRNPGGPSQWWAQEGMIQVSFDNRSSGHFGKNGLNYIHRQLGLYEIEDYMACATWLRNQSFVDSNRLAITGGSFGGYMTCMALTYGASVFTHGIANSSVTDWQLYDTHYTERYMDTPQENPEGYRNTAVMTYADRYKGLLRIVHGTSDDNVHMQNSIQLIDKMEELGKHFEFMLYPGERHGIGGNSANKRRHAQMEAYRFYYNELLQKPIPPQFLQTQPGRRSF